MYELTNSLLGNIACGAVSTVNTSENSKHLVKNLNFKSILVAAMNTYFKNSLVAVKFNTT